MCSGIKSIEINIEITNLKTGFINFTVHRTICLTKKLVFSISLVLYWWAGEKWKKVDFEKEKYFSNSNLMSVLLATLKSATSFMKEIMSTVQKLQVEGSIITVL